MTTSEALALLGLPSSPVPSEEEIRRAYKLAAARAHPDAGGSAEAFARLHEAYSTGLVAARAVVEAADLAAVKCQACDGKGYTLHTYGARALQIACGACGGTGLDDG